MIEQVLAQLNELTSHRYSDEDFISILSPFYDLEETASRPNAKPGTVEDLHFSYNWNNKLDCKAFTTIRIYNPSKHVPGVKLRIMLKRTENKGVGMIADVRPFHLANMNPFISFLDTGYPVVQCKNVILKMYQKIDFTEKKLALILIVKE